MVDPPNLTKYTSECYHCQEMFSEHSTEILLFKMQEHNKKSHNISDVSPKREKVSPVERDCLPKINKASGEMTMEEWVGFEYNWRIWKKNLNIEIRDSNQPLCCCFLKIQ